MAKSRSTTLSTSLPPHSPSFGLRCWRGAPFPMDLWHRHDDVELNFVVAGELTYLFGRGRVTAYTGDVLVFWAGMPHRLASFAPHTQLVWVTLPLALFLRWRLPSTLEEPILNGRCVLQHSAQLDELDRALHERWIAELQMSNEADHAIVMLELEARLRRVARRATPDTQAGAESWPVEGAAERMLRLMAERHAEPLRVEDVATAVSLHPNYAMQLFRAAFGVSMVRFLTQQRVVHAQRLLLTTDLSVYEIALEAGFGSSSRFYTAFKAICGTTPRAYRQALLAGSRA